MNLVFKCDYCNFMGTEEEVREHEPKCYENYDRKSCNTCVHKGEIKYTNDGWVYECSIGVNVPVKCVYEFCPRYERKEKPKSYINFSNPFGWFGW